MPGRIPIFLNTNIWRIIHYFKVKKLAKINIFIESEFSFIICFKMAASFGETKFMEYSVVALLLQIKGF